MIFICMPSVLKSYHVCLKKIKHQILTRREFVKTQPTQYGVQILKWCKRGSTIMCSIGLHPTGPPSRQPLLDRVGARHIFIRLTSIVQHSKVQGLAAIQSYHMYNVHCKFLNARFECNSIVIFIYSHYPLDLNARSSSLDHLILKHLVADTFAFGSRG